MLTNFILLYNTLNFFTILWFIFWVIVFLASFKCWGEYNWVFGFLIIYIIIFPIYRRWDRYLNNIIPTWPENVVSIFLILLLSFFWIILFIKLLPNMLYFLLQKGFIKDALLDHKIIRKLLDPHINEKSRIKKWLENFSLIWSSWVDLFFILPYRRPFIFFVKNFPKYLDSNVKILWFFSFTLFLPRILTLLALFYDIYVEKQLCWFPTMALLLTISVITRMCLTMVEKGSRENYDYVVSHLNFKPTEKEEFSEDIQKEIKENFSEHVRIVKLVVKEEIKGQFDQEGYDLLFSDYYAFVDILQWFDITNALLDNVSSKISLLFVTAQLGAQIIILLNS